MFCFLNVMQVLHTQKLEYSIAMVSGFYEYMSRGGRIPLCLPD